VRRAQQAEIKLEAGWSMRDLGRRIAFGVKATHTPQWLDKPNDYGTQWYPVGDIGMRGVLTPGIGSYNVAQMYLKPDILREAPQYGPTFVEKIQRRAGSYLDAIQFDMLPFDDPDADLRDTLRAVGALDLIVQCHARAMSQGPTRAIEMLKRLSDEIDYVLFDASHGTGKTLDTDALLPFLEAAYNDPDFAAFGTNFGIAGGLDGPTVESALPAVVAQFPEVSWDAEGKLHDKIEDGGDGSLNMHRVHQYMLSSVRVLGFASLADSTED
jgi:hypothetical protein